MIQSQLYGNIEQRKLYNKVAFIIKDNEAAGIIKEKVNEICALVPAFENELDLRPGKTRQSKDYCIFVFKNGSYFDNIAARETSRGKRRHGGLIEECVGVDGQILSEVIIPTMNVSRLCMDGTMHPEETLNKSQIFVNFFWTKRYKILSLFFILYERR